MTLIIFSIVLVLIGIGLVAWDEFGPSLRETWFGGGVMFTGWVLLVITLLFWIGSTKDSEITYYQLEQEKQTIELIQAENKNVDRVMLNKMVVEYNNKVINIQMRLSRFMYKDYYSKKVNWDALELIEWK